MSVADNDMHDRSGVGPNAEQKGIPGCGIDLSKADFQLLSRYYNQTASLRTEQEIRINEWLKRQIEQR